MPKIIQEDKRIVALNEIEAALSIIRSINASLGEGNSFLITAASSDGKTVGKVSVDEKDITKLRSILTGQRARLVKEVLAKAARHRIELDDEDMLCLEGKVTEKKRKAEKNSVNEAVDPS